MRDHKSLIAWQRSHKVVLLAMDVCEKYCRPGAAAAFSQLQKACLSVQLNIAEGYARRTPAYLRSHLTIAYGSAVETSDLLELLDERELVPKEEIAPAVEESRKVQALILALLRKLRG